METLKTNSYAIKVRLFVVVLMVVLGFIGVIVTDMNKDGAWYYWRFLAVIYALLSLGLSWHLKKKGLKITLLTIWHEIAHWTGLIGAIFIASYFVHMGIVGRFEASLLTLLLLSLASYLAGVYIEPTMLVVGLMLGAFAAGIAFLGTYIYNILLPVTVVGVIVLVVFIHRAHKNLKKKV